MKRNIPKYKNKYRSASARAQWWDYAWQGSYFITICTADRRPYFGHIDHGKMKLSPVGAMADIFWHEIGNHARAVELDAFVVMPNHVHGILILNERSDDDSIDHTKSINNNDVGTRHALSLQPPQPFPGNPKTADTQSDKTIGQSRFQNPGKNTVSAIIGSYKSAVTRHARRLGFEFGWQSRFHDHIIRDDASFSRIAQYIEENPKNWKGDQFYGP